MKLTTVSLQLEYDYKGVFLSMRLTLEFHYKGDLGLKLTMVSLQLEYDY